MSLPTLSTISSVEKLSAALSLLLEPSAALSSLSESLFPFLSQLQSWDQLLAKAQQLVNSWPKEDGGIERRWEFVASHPRIGERSNLSALSKAEQSHKLQNGEADTEEAVYERLATLNRLYEFRFPGLIYTIFVNGRSKAEIVPEMEEDLRLSLAPPTVISREPKFDNLVVHLTPVEKGSTEYEAEVERSMRELWAIAKSRAATLLASEQK